MDYDEFGGVQRFVILSEAKDLRYREALEILHCAALHSE